ncbi:Phosphotransferase enzyme family [Micromonospora matsumotoense]|uniref:Phosphotransferase enzyme family n=1 Tax=Micromonospora matsumotoense TaxID=121616 RepID=A0A1C5ASE1_9ACTN|nr:Phosphotransferase enzyme family [Micromonospora matsumotoense]
MIDFGDLCTGDPAYDLAAGWLLLPDDTADHFHAGTPAHAALQRLIATR